MHRFFIEPCCFVGDRVELSGPLAHQLSHVLRMQVGERIIVLNNRGGEFEVCLSSVEGKLVTGDILAERQASGEPFVDVTVFQAMLKRDKFEWVLQKVTEIGGGAICPVVTERCLVRETNLKPNRRERWEKILTEAAEQSHRGRVPTLGEPQTLTQVLKVLETYDRVLIACPHTHSSDLKSQLGELPSKVSVAVLIGPEGGFSSEEVDMALQAGALPINLGPRILRTETAAVVVTSLVLYELGAFTLNPEP